MTSYQERCKRSAAILNSMLDKDYHRRFRERPYKPLRKGYA